MLEDSIIKEVREARDAYARRFNYDISAMCRDLVASTPKNQRASRLPIPPRFIPADVTVPPKA